MAQASMVSEIHVQHPMTQKSHILGQNLPLVG